MSGSRLVEYFLVAGVGAESSPYGGEDVDGVASPVSPMSPLSEHTSKGKLPM